MATKLTILTVLPKFKKTWISLLRKILLNFTHFVDFLFFYILLIGSEMKWKVPHKNLKKSIDFDGNNERKFLYISTIKKKRTEKRTLSDAIILFLIKSIMCQTVLMLSDCFWWKNECFNVSIMFSPTLVKKAFHIYVSEYLFCSAALWCAF